MIFLVSASGSLLYPLQTKMNFSESRITPYVSMPHTSHSSAILVRTKLSICKNLYIFFIIFVKNIAVKLLYSL